MRLTPFATPSENPVIASRWARFRFEVFLALNTQLVSGMSYLSITTYYKHGLLPCTALPHVPSKRHTPRQALRCYRAGCTFSRSAVSCGSASCVRDVPQPQPHPQLASLVVSDNAEGGRIVKGSKVEVDMASPFWGIDNVCGSCASEASLPRH